MTNTTPVDFLLLEVSNNIDTVKDYIPPKDCRILTSLTKQVSQGHFLTENQSRLLLKIFKENIRSVKKINKDAGSIIEGSIWSKPFRVIPKVRKIFLDPGKNDKIFIRFTYDKRLKNKLNDLSKQFYGPVGIDGSHDYQVIYTEKNILTLVDAFLQEDFEIDQKIMDFYHEIKEAVKNYKNSFDILGNDSEELQKIVTPRTGAVTSDNLVLLYDNRHAYQYEIFEEILEKSLKNAIAQRSNSKVFVNSNSVELTTLIETLKSLDRFPVLAIFDGHASKLDRKILENVNFSLEKNGIFDDVGIYFRFDKTTDTDNFNALVSDLCYNKNLSDQTQFVGIANNKIPKFMMKMGWKPRTVLSFTNTFKNNKSSIYFADVDLVIYYNDKLPFVGGVDAIM